MRNLLSLLTLLSCVSFLHSQTVLNEAIQLKWNSSPYLHSPTEQDITEIWGFEGAIFSSESPSTPVYLKVIPLNEFSQIKASLEKVQSSPLPVNEAQFTGDLTNEFKVVTSVEKNRSQYVAKVAILPIAKNGAAYKKLDAANLRIQITPKAVPSFRGPGNITISALADGTLFKIGVTEAGMHQLTYTFLKDELGVDIDNINPRNLQLWGAGGGPLPELVATTRIDDLVEIPIQINGETDGSFDSNDKMLFYAEGPDKWTFNESLQQFVYQKNIYDTQNYYFLKIGASPGKRLESKASLNTSDYTSTSFDALVHYEEDRVNLLHEYSLGQGSGQQWFGDLFEVVRERTYDEFNIQGLLNQPARIKMDFAGRSQASSRVKVSLDNQDFLSSTINQVNTGNSETLYADLGRVNTTFVPSQSNLPVSVRYEENNATSRGWLDFIEIQAKASLALNGNQLIFRDTMSTNYPSSTFVLANANTNTAVWEITNPLSPTAISGSFGQNMYQFAVPTESLTEFIAFNTTASFPSPVAIGTIANQNLHGIDNVDMIVLYPAEFEAQATQFTEHRSQTSGLDIQMVLVTDIYNEFSSGRLDPTAIRDFAKMLHDRSPKFKYLLLFGDGSFDARGLYEFENKSNFIPVYETPQSRAPIDAYPSDDYFVLLSDDEGFALKGALDIAIGRLPVKTVSEAQALVDKIIRYDTNQNLLGDWRNKCVFIADDEDDNLHVIDADGIAKYLDTTYTDLNLDKIYFDAFQQIATPGGEKYPTVTEAINKTMFKGALVINYLGHGGSKGWAQERVLGLADIDAWTNTSHHPLLITATCSFAGYDDPAFTTAGERTILNTKSGAMALFTTVRAVFANSNEQLARSTFEQVFEPDETGNYPTLGEVLRKGKNSNSSNFFTNNARKFALLGDPSMHLAIPQYQVATTSINGVAVTTSVPDTLKALQKVSIQGQVQDENGNLLSDFNGEIFPTVFDKAITLSTLGQDSRSTPYSFSLQKNILFKGTASVTNGLFEFTFVIPKDINYEFGEGKISYYAKENAGLRDAKGSYENIVIGGTDPNASTDDQGPLVEVFMNNEDFVFGGITDENPILLVKLQDDNGINVAGSSVGHDLSGVLNENSQNTYSLNDFYEAELDDYTKGTVRFPLFNIPAGRHSIRVKAWDIANNSAEGLTEFVVAESATAALDHVLNYPNPFTTATNFQFEHNMSDQLVNVHIRIFTVSGKLVKTIEEQVLSDGYRVTDIAWNGTDDFGQQLARGVYLYKIKLASAEAGLGNIVIESDFEKLVILK